ncbi:hypothetical protein TRFO_27483 [Tritrichomonas foetus]|uniref:Uncharacterized protein n=1 Tax=Tritrichomonas foetus TaxID=1144522 RepID=A0A1J4K5C9_9EUKA|nr:hypothetical protein TRFO_27483 [Tritrichomonas foetus]|eukprot:OHT04924.1 hypothetical protein TRFO_27483 [Tritrichomonas foetus]
MNTQMNNQMNAQMNNPVCNSFNNFANNKINNQLINQKSAPFPNAIPANQIVSAQNVPRSQNNFAPNIMYQNNIQPNIQQNIQSNMQLTVANSFQNNKNMPIINPVQNLNMGKNIPVSAQPQPAIIHIIPVQTQPVIQISPVNYAQVPSSNVVIPPLNHRSPNAENQAPLKKQFQGTIQHIIQKPKDNQNNNSSLTQEMPTKLQNTTSKTVTVIKSKPSISFPSIENLIKDKSESSESRDHIFVDSSTDDQEETNNEYNDDANYIHHHNNHNNPNENPQFYQQNLANAHQFPVISDFVTVFTQTDTNVRNKTTSDVSVQASANYNATSVQTEQFPPDIIIQ